MYIYSKEPPILEPQGDSWNPTIYIPKGSLSSYKESTMWMYYNLIEMDSNDTTLIDATTYSNEVTSTFDNIYYKRTFNNTKWQALYIPFSLQYSDWKDGYEIAYINGLRQLDKDDDGVIDETIMDVIKIKEGETYPNTPYLIRAKSTGEQTISTENATLYPNETNTIDCSTTITKYNFTGTYTTIPASTLISNNYYAMGGGSLIMTDGTSDLSPFRWYLSIVARNPMYKQSSSASAKKIIINVLDDEVNEATGISEINASSQAASTVYDLNGRKMNSKALKSGLYIKNGKKYIVK